MKILEDLEQWKAEYQRIWLAHYKESGEFDWKRSNRPKNSTAPTDPGIDLSQSRLALISSAGAYLPDSQKPFYTDFAALGDYTIRLFPNPTPFEALAFAIGRPHDIAQQRRILLATLALLTQPAPIW